MLAAIAALLPAAAGTFAIAVIVISWLRYRPLVLSLRQELAACEATRELRYVVMTTRVVAAEVRPLAAGRMQSRPLHHAARRRAFPVAA